jgi:hypothetical protein
MSYSHWGIAAYQPYRENVSIAFFGFLAQLLLMEFWHECCYVRVRHACVISLLGRVRIAAYLPWRCYKLF